MITVRVSEDEFATFRTVTQSRGYRSVSDLARAALNSVIGDLPNPQETLADRLDRLDNRVARLEQIATGLEAAHR